MTCEKRGDEDAYVIQEERGRKGKKRDEKGGRKAK
jgi:hypothetical protein